MPDDINTTEEADLAELQEARNRERAARAEEAAAEDADRPIEPAGESTINSAELGVALSFAILVDALQAGISMAAAAITSIPIIGTIIGPALLSGSGIVSAGISAGVFIIFFLWIYFKGLKMKSNSTIKKWGLRLIFAALGIEILPIISSIPGWTGYIVSIFIMNKMGEKIPFARGLSKKTV